MTQRAIDGPYIYFVTTNTTFGGWFFDSVERAIQLGSIIRAACKENQFVLYGYCILPDHIHLLVRKNGTYTLSVLMKTIKGRFWRFVSGSRVWQPRFNFRIVNNDEYLANIADYIVYNYRKMDLDETFGNPPYVFVDWKQFGQ